MNIEYENHQLNKNDTWVRDGMKGILDHNTDWPSFFPVLRMFFAWEMLYLNLSWCTNKYNEQLFWNMSRNSNNTVHW